MVHFITFPGDFEPWSDWSQCTTSCGEGKQTRQRECRGQYGCKDGDILVEMNGQDTDERRCDPANPPCKCDDGYFGYPNCQACDCDGQGSQSNNCDNNGKCSCKDGFTGDKCDSSGTEKIKGDFATKLFMMFLVLFLL